MLSVGIAIELYSILLLVLLGFYMVRRISTSVHSDVWFLALFALVIARTLGDLVCDLSFNMKGAEGIAWHRLGTFAVYLCSLFVLFAFAMFLYHFVGRRKKPAPGFVIACGVICAGCAVMLVINAAALYAGENGFIYTINEGNRYMRESLFWVMQAAMTAVILIELSFIITYRKMLSTAEKAYLSLYILVPAITTFLQILLDGIPMITVGLSVSAIFVFMNVESENSGRVRGESDLARREIQEVVDLYAESVQDIFSAIVRVDLKNDSYIKLSFNDKGPVSESFEGWTAELTRIVEQEVHPDDRGVCYQRIHTGIVRMLPVGSNISASYRRNKNADGNYRWFETTVKIVPMRNGNTAALYMTHDIEDEVRERTHLKDISEHDALTDLFNRGKLESMMENEYSKLFSCGVLFLDLNGLKRTNDIYGHDAGDKLLCRAADSLRSITSRRVHAYRYGGDEFIVIAPDVSAAQFEDLIDLWHIRLEHLNESENTQISIAYGSAWAEGRIRVDELIAKADGAMYANKREPGGV